MPNMHLFLMVLTQLVIFYFTTFKTVHYKPGERVPYEAVLYSKDAYLGMYMVSSATALLDQRNRL